LSPTFVVMEISNLFFQSTLIIYVTTWFYQLSMNDNLVNRLWKKIWMTSIDFECFCINYLCFYFHYLSFNVYSTDNKHGVQRQVRRCRRRFFLYIISNISAKPQVFYYLVSDAKIFDITFLCETKRRVTLQQGWQLYIINYNNYHIILHCT
jgi:hypothetical protein